MRDVSQHRRLEGLGLVVPGNLKGLTPSVLDSGPVQEFSNLGDATLRRDLGQGFGAVM